MDNKNEKEQEGANSGERKGLLRESKNTLSQRRKGYVQQKAMNPKYPGPQKDCITEQYSKMKKGQG